MAETSSELDRLSELPEHVKHHILSLLTLREAIDTSLLSWAWKDVWLHLPCLDFGEKIFNKFMKGHEYSGERERKRLFMDYVDRFLAKRTLTLKHGNWSSLRKLWLYKPSLMSRYDLPGNNKLRISKTVDEFRFRVDRWLDYAVSCLNIKELSITCSFQDYYSEYMYELPKHIIKDAYSLTSLSLTCVKFDQDMIDTIASNCLLLEFLCFERCTSECSLLRLSGFKRLIEVHVGSFFSSSFEIVSTTLETFSCTNNGFRPADGACKINVASCWALKYLKIHGATLTDDSLGRHLAHLSNLQELALGNCSSLTRVKISNHGLKDLSLRNSENKLVGVEIDAVDLKKFTYSQTHSHPSPVFTFKDFHSEDTTVSIGSELIEALWDDQIVKFMGQLDQCSRYLKARAFVSAFKERYCKEQKFCPLYYVKLLKVESRGVQCYAELVDDMLCLFPRLEMGRFSCVSSSLGGPEIILKFKYKGGADDQENCGHCWWHQLLEVTIKNTKGAEEYIALLKAFFENKRTVDKIVVRVG